MAQGGEPGPKPAAADEVLGSWKEIAQYLGRDVRTVMRWERTRAMPVHRLPGSVKAPVHALKSELDAWRSGPIDDQSPVSRIAEVPQPASQSAAITARARQAGRTISENAPMPIQNHLT